MKMDEENYFAHYGTPRKSGRYPWGSGGNVVAKNNKEFLDVISELKAKGLGDTDIAKAFGMSTTEYRAVRSTANAERKAEHISTAEALKAKGWSDRAIGERLGGRGESYVRTLLAPGAKDTADTIQTTAAILKKEVDKHGFIDVGAGTENYLCVSPERMRVALSVLKQDGYEVLSGIPLPQLGTQFDTKLKVLAKPGTTWGEVARNKDKIRLVNERLNDVGEGTLGMLPPLVLNPKRVGVRYGSEGGSEADGVMFIRPGVPDVSLGNAKYAQVRIQVGNDHYLKGMAIYKDDLPKGIDILFNTNKESTGNHLDALKELKKDSDNPFGAVIRNQLTAPDPSDPTGKRRINTSVVNIVNEEGDWGKWSKSIASQVLSKQSPKLAKEQLDMTYERKMNEFEEISKLTNPTVRKKLLMEFAEGSDSSAVHLKAASLPNQSWNVILPVSSMKPTEIFAPNYDNGTRVALIRYPHGGKFEIPELIVNNRNREASRLLKDAKDGVGIHHSVAEHLSGADFDGDTVLVIPNGKGKIKADPMLEGLKNFNPKTMYPEIEGMKVMTTAQKGKEMGRISNLITDMTLRQASRQELARAIRHSMVVIDAEKHRLNYRESERKENIKELRAKYQTKADGSSGGASTLISRAKAEVRVPKTKPRLAKDGGPIDKETGALVFVETGETNYRTGAPKLVKRKRLEITDDAHTLSSNTRMENLYADHSNRLKTLANRARLDAINTPRASKSVSAKKVYADEVTSLRAALDLAQRNAPLERRAQIIGNTVFQAKKASAPEMDFASEKKLKAQALDAARTRTGAKKNRIHLTDRQWEAIQAGAISDTMLSEILLHSDMDRVRELAQPKTAKKMTTAKTRRAQSMLASGYTRAEVARQLGVSLSTLDLATTEGGS